jgi:hypothetical protein
MRNFLAGVLIFPASTWPLKRETRSGRTCVVQQHQQQHHTLFTRENERGEEKVFILHQNAHKAARTASPDQPLGYTRIRETLTQLNAKAKHITTIFCTTVPVYLSEGLFVACHSS